MPLGDLADGLKVVFGFLNIIFSEDFDAGLNSLGNFRGRAGFNRGHQLNAGGQVAEKFPDVLRNISHG